MSENITPKKFKCATSFCSAIHKVEGGVVMVGEYRAQSELTSMGIPQVSDGNSAVYWPDAFLDAFVKEYVAKRWLGGDN